MKVAFIGYSGHGYVCMDTALELGIEIEGYYDSEEKNTNPFDLIYFGSENLIINEAKTLFVSIGDNKIRKLVYDKLKNTNSFISLTHPNSKVSKTVTTSTNVLISSGAIINAFSILGQGSIINSGAIIEHECKIGNFAHIAPGAVLAGNVVIGDHSFIGANSTVKQGVTIGDNVIVGAGAVVLNNIPSNSIYVGNPARKLVK
jgi:sugar O-acyltransferase (sialic acid O-acetyltransferase NeuD family)